MASMAMSKQISNLNQMIDQIRRITRSQKFRGVCANEITDDFVFAGIESAPKMAFVLLMVDFWLADSVCTSHLTPERSYFTKYTPT